MTMSSAAPDAQDNLLEDDYEELTDLGNARRFVEAARGTFLYVPEWMSWVHWDGMRWAPDGYLPAMELAAQVAQRMALHAEDAPRRGGDREKMVRHAVVSQSLGRLRAMVTTAGEALPDLKASADSFDTDRDLLNCLNGTVDLRTGALYPHLSSARITKLVPVRYDPEATAPLWEQTLLEVLPDAQVRDFLQRAAGYTATGYVNEHCLFFAHGDGRNGKGIVIGTVQKILGEYATPAPPNILMKTNSERHSTEIVNLRGHRLVKVDETGRGKAWNEERVKQLTGGDQLKGRRLYEDFDTDGFRPTHKFWVSSNYRPRVSGTDEGIWSRIRLIEFPVRFCDETDEAAIAAGRKVQDRLLEEKLLKQAAGILRWIVDGAVAWTSGGLRVPEAVREANADYRDEQDVFGDFLEGFPALRDLVPGAGVPLPDVVRAYQTFTLGKESAERMDSREVAAELRRRNFDVSRGAKGARKVRRAGGQDECLARAEVAP
jgi:putative DNA primase/helicase